MKKIMCEMCGSNELIKQDGYFVCQACGMKYSPEEAKKMMIEGTVDVQGTVKVDNTAFVEKYLANARRAKQKEDWEETEKYYNLVEQNDPTNIEAIFYSAYGKAKASLLSSDLYKRQAAFKVLENSISVIDDNYDYDNDTEELKIIEGIGADIIAMSMSTYVYNKTQNGYGVTIKDDSSQTVKLFIALSIAFANSVDNIVSGYNDDKKQQKIQLLKIALLQIECVYRRKLFVNHEAMRARIEDYHKKINMLDPSHNVITAQQMLSNSTKGFILPKVLGLLFAFVPVLGIIFNMMFYLGVKKSEDKKAIKFLRATIIMSIISTIFYLAFVVFTLLIM